MTPKAFYRLAQLNIITMAAAGLGYAQGITFVADPASLAFGPTTNTQQDVLIRTSTNQAALTSVTCPTGLTCTLIRDTTQLAAPGPAFTPFTLRVIASAAAGTANASIGLQAQGVTTGSVPVALSYTGGTGSATFSAFPTALTFAQTGTTPPTTQTISVSSTTGTIPNYTPHVDYLSGGSGWLTVSPALDLLTASTFITVTPNSAALPTGSYSANLTLTPQTGLSVVIPIYLTVNGAGGSSLTVSPNPLTFLYASGTTTPQIANVTVSGPAAGIPFTASVAGNIAAFISVPNGSTGNLVQILLSNPQLIPTGTTGTITFSAAGYSPAVLSVQVNGNGTGGLGSLSVTPAVVSLTGVLGAGQTVTPASVIVQSTDLTQPSVFFNTSVVSTNNFLTVTPASGTTPATLSLGANLSAITAPGTYVGTVTITPFNSIVSQTVNVTLTVTGTVTVTADPASVAITIPSNTGALQSRTVNLTSSATGVPFTASATTTTGSGWLSVQASSSVLPASLTVTANPAGLTAGTYQGSVTVTTGGTVSATIPVTLTITPIGSLQVSTTPLVFNYQTTGTSAPAPQTVAVSSTGAQSIPFNAVATTTTGGNWLQVTPGTSTTPGSVTVSVLPTGLAAGSYSGNVTITSSGATNSPQVVPVTINVTTPAIPQITSFTNAASFSPTQAIPGLIVTIFGKDLGPATLVAGQVNAGQLTTSVSGTRVLFDNVAAPIIYTSATQVSAVVPYEIAGRFTSRLQVEYNGQISSQVELRVGDTAPALFTRAATGSGQAAALNQDMGPNLPTNGETRGRVIVLYATGEGQTNPQGQTGRVVQAVASDLRRPVAPVSVRIGGRPAAVEYAGSAPGFVSGALQINVRIPQDAPTGPNVPIELQIGQVTSQSNVTVAIQ